MAQLLSSTSFDNLMDDMAHGYAHSNGAYHYATDGEELLVVMIHGFCDFGLTWGYQMQGRGQYYEVVVTDQRDYNISDKPVRNENYSRCYLVSDIAAVIKHFDEEEAIVVGHDWGGSVFGNSPSLFLK